MRKDENLLTMFFSSSQIFGWLNCYKGTLLRSAVFATYTLSTRVSLWLTVAMFLFAWPHPRGSGYASTRRSLYSYLEQLLIVIDISFYQSVCTGNVTSVSTSLLQHF